MFGHITRTYEEVFIFHELLKSFSGRKTFAFQHLDSSYSRLRLRT